MGKGSLAPNLWKCLKVLFVLQMSEVSVDEVLMHYFEKNVVSFWGESPPQTSTGVLPLDTARDFRPSEPLIVHSWKKSCGRR